MFQIFEIEIRISKFAKLYRNMIILSQSMLKSFSEGSFTRPITEANFALS
jgi:hypothetical protein